MKIPSFIEQLKKINKKHLLVAALVGVLFLIISVPTEEGKKEETSNVKDTESIIIEENKDSSYRKELERQLETILATMEGVGKVQVMITMQDEGESVVEKDITRTEEETTEEDGQGTKRTVSAVSAQEETLYVQTDASGTPFVTKELNPQVEGVLVVAQGGGNATVVQNISDAVLALFPVEVHKIKVVKMNE